MNQYLLKVFFSFDYFIKLKYKTFFFKKIVNETEYNYMFQNFVLNKESGTIFIVKASNTLSSFDFLVNCDQNGKLCSSFYSK